jgi:hypothetical protein
MSAARILTLAVALFVCPVAAAWIALWLHDRPWRAVPRMPRRFAGSRWPR